MNISYILDISGLDFYDSDINKLELPIEDDIRWSAWSLGRSCELRSPSWPGKCCAVINGTITLLVTEYLSSPLISSNHLDRKIKEFDQVLNSNFQNCFILSVDSWFIDDFMKSHGPFWHLDPIYIEIFYRWMMEKPSKYWRIVNDQPRKTKEAISQKPWCIADP